MCYDMSFFSNIKLIADFLKIDFDNTIQFEPTYHKVAQAFNKWPVVINDDARPDDPRLSDSVGQAVGRGLKIKLFEWGVIADYMNTPEKIKEYRTSMANARSEKIIDDKRSVWHRIRNQRCIVFTTGFFEHHEAGLKKKVPYFIKVKGVPVFCFAGLYNYSPIPDFETGEAIGTFSIITRPANSLLAKIHNGGANSNRMPLILTKELAEKWLTKKLSDEGINEIINYEFPATEMEAWPVNTIRTRKKDNENVIKEMKYEKFLGI